MENKTINQAKMKRKLKIGFFVFALFAIIALTAWAAIVINQQLSDKTKQIAGNGVNYEVSTSTKDAKTEIAKTNPVVNNEVMTASGVQAKNDVTPMSPSGPRVTDPINTDLPAGVINLTVNSAGFSPNEFTVKANEPATIALTSTDEATTHRLTFDDLSLSAVSIGVIAKETRAITFKAPAAGKYPFHCGLPGHAAIENGLMIVK